MAVTIGWYFCILSVLWFYWTNGNDLFVANFEPVVILHYSYLWY